MQVHLMNVEQRQAAVDPQTKLSDLGCESACRLLSSTTTIAMDLPKCSGATENCALSLAANSTWDLWHLPVARSCAKISV